MELIGLSKNDEHECDENDVKSAIIIKKSTKACPSCGVRIARAYGCSQMWCTECNTAFSWATGKVLNTHVGFHNPHYAEWIQNGGHPVDEQGPCGNDVLSHYRFYRKRQKYSRACCQECQAIIRSVFESILHAQTVIIPRLREQINRHGTVGDAKNRDLRVKYLLGDIDQSHLTKVSYMRDNVAEKKRAMLQILEVFVNVMDDRLRHLMSRKTVKTYHKAELELLNIVHELRDYCNNEFKKLSVNYNMKAFRIASNFRIDVYSYTMGM